VPWPIRARPVLATAAAADRIAPAGQWMARGLPDSPLLSWRPLGDPQGADGLRAPRPSPRPCTPRRDGVPIPHALASKGPGAQAAAERVGVPPGALRLAPMNASKECAAASILVLLTPPSQARRANGLEVGC